MPRFPSFEVFKEFAIASVLEIEEPAKKLLEDVYQCVTKVRATLVCFFGVTHVCFRLRSD